MIDLCKWLKCKKEVSMPSVTPIKQNIEDRLRTALVEETSFPEVIHDVLIAQFKLETGHFNSKLCELHHNYAGLKFRHEMLTYCEKIAYRSHEGYDIDYCKFDSPEHFVKGYEVFISRDVYQGVWDSMRTGEQYLEFIVEAGFCPDNGYVNKVLSLI